MLLDDLDPLKVQSGSASHISAALCGKEGVVLQFLGTVLCTTLALRGRSVWLNWLMRVSSHVYFVLSRMGTLFGPSMFG